MPCGKVGGGEKQKLGKNYFGIHDGESSEKRWFQFKDLRLTDWGGTWLVNQEGKEGKGTPFGKGCEKTRS